MKFNADPETDPEGWEEDQLIWNAEKLADLSGCVILPICKYSSLRRELERRLAERLKGRLEPAILEVFIPDDVDPLLGRQVRDVERGRYWVVSGMGQLPREQRLVAWGRLNAWRNNVVRDGRRVWLWLETDEMPGEVALFAPDLFGVRAGMPEFRYLRPDPHAPPPAPPPAPCIPPKDRGPFPFFGTAHPLISSLGSDFSVQPQLRTPPRGFGTAAGGAPDQRAGNAAVEWLRLLRLDLGAARTEGPEQLTELLHQRGLAQAAYDLAGEMLREAKQREQPGDPFLVRLRSCLNKSHESPTDAS
jgi:hypothetical protein